MKILGNTEIKKLIGKVIIDGDETCVRRNAYILRLGPEGGHQNTGKEIESGKQSKGVVIPQGHSVEVVALETLDFRLETIRELYRNPY